MLARVLEQEKVSVLWLTAGLFHQVVDSDLQALRGVRTLLAGGDVLSVPHVRRFLETLPDVRLVNGYGPTEGITFSVCHRIEVDGLGETVPIGRPISNTRVYVLDAHMGPVPVGAAGELYIAGDGLARGYLGRAGLTASRFIADPFGAPGARMYRTGDQVRRRSSGVIEFMGRIDQQVKVRGFRIELGEIEAVLLKHPGVAQAAVVAREDGSAGKQLVAYVVPAAGAGEDTTELRAALRQMLPDYMVPNAFVALTELPLTANGKVNRKALPAPEARDKDVAFVAPRTPTEEALADIWREVLGLEAVGLNDNFFDLGGHSLLAMRVMARVQEVFEASVPVRLLFEAPTLEAFAEALLAELLGDAAEDELAS